MFSIIIAYDVNSSGEIRFIGKTNTDSQGQYNIELEAGKYTVFFNKENYERDSSDVSIISKNVNLNMKLVPLNSISGIVMSSPDKEPLPDVPVQLWEGSSTKGTQLKTSTTDSNGKYSFSLDESSSGSYTIVITKSGYKKATYTVSLRTGIATHHSTYLEKEIDGVPIDEEHFPDENFRSYVKDNFDTDNDGVLNSDEIKNATVLSLSRDPSSIYESLARLKLQLGLDVWQYTPIVYSEIIYSLQGIEYLSALRLLDCREQKLTELDVSHNTSLQYLYCGDNQLISLNVRGCRALEDLLCDNNKLTTLDTSNCTALKRLVVRGNQLITLNVKGCSALEYLFCSENKLTTLDVGTCVALTGLDCSNNQLSVLNVSQNVALGFLDCLNNLITSLDLSNTKIDFITNTQYPAVYGIDYYVSCDSNVEVILPSSTTSSINGSVSAATNNSVKDLIIIASIPSFTATRTDEYVFDVSLDEEIPEGTKLILLNNSEYLLTLKQGKLTPL